MSNENNADESQDTREREEMRKLFIGGLNRSTVLDTLAEHFSQYGEIVDKVIISDKQTGTSRGFGFVTFTESSSVEEALRAKPHKIDDKSIEIKRATPKAWPAAQHARVNKLFIGGLDTETTTDEIKEYIMSRHEGYVEIEKIDILKDSDGKNRSFGFIFVENEDMADRLAMSEEKFFLGRKRMGIKKAEPKVDGGDGRGGAQGNRDRGSQGYGGGYGGGRTDNAYGTGFKSYSGPQGGYGGGGFGAQGGYGGGGFGAQGGFGAPGGYGAGGYGQSYGGGYGGRY